MYVKEMSVFAADTDPRFRPTAHLVQDGPKTPPVLTYWQDRVAAGLYVGDLVQWETQGNSYDTIVIGAEGPYVKVLTRDSNWSGSQVVLVAIDEIKMLNGIRVKVDKTYAGQIPS